MGFISALHTFASWFEKEWAKVVNAAPKIEKVISAGLEYAQNILQVVIEVEGEAAGPVLEEVLQSVIVARSTLYDSGVSVTLASAIKAIASNLSGLLEAAHIKNANSIALVTKVVNTLAGLIGALAPAA